MSSNVLYLPQASLGTPKTAQRFTPKREAYGMLSSAAAALAVSPPSHRRRETFDIASFTDWGVVCSSVCLNHALALLLLRTPLREAAASTDPPAAQKRALDRFFGSGRWTRTAWGWSLQELAAGHVQRVLEASMQPLASPATLLGQAFLHSECRRPAATADGVGPSPPSPARPCR